MTYIKIIILFFILSISHLASAHSKTEIGLRFIEEDGKTYVEAHLTSATLFDLLYDMYPYLESQESLNLGNYLSEYEIYFNEHFDLKLNGKSRQLKYIDSNLITHDAAIKFLVKDFEEQIRKYEVTVGGFEFYKKPSFAVLITTASITESHFLDKVDNKCVGSSPLLVSSHKEKQLMFFRYGAVVLLGGIIMLIWVARRRESLA